MDTTATAGLGLTMQLEISQDAGTFGFCASEMFDWVDLASNLVDNTLASLPGVFYVPDMGFIVTPTYTKQDTMMGDWDLTTSLYPITIDPSWSQQTDSETGNKGILYGNASPSISVSALNTGLLSLGQPGQLKIGRGFTTNSITPYTTTITLAPDAAYDPNNVGNVPVQISLNQNTPPTISVGTWNIATGSWVYTVKAVSKKYSKSQDIFGSGLSTWLCWFSFNSYNTIVIYLAGEWYYIKGDLGTTYTVPDANGASTGTITFNSPIQIAAGSLQVQATNGVVWFNYFPTQFSNTTSGDPYSTTITGPPIRLDYPYNGTGQVYFPNVTIPTGCSVVGHVNTYVNPDPTINTYGMVIQYTVTITIPNNTNTPTIPQIQVHIPAVYVSGTLNTPPIILTENDILEVIEHDYENQNIIQGAQVGGGIIGWSLDHDLYFKLTNSAARWVGSLGGTQHCYSWSRALTQLNSATGQMVAVGPLVPHSQGWIGFNTNNYRHDPYREFHLVASDKMHQLRDVPGNMELYLDGWCMYSAMRYQFERGGITSNFIDMTSDQGFYTCPYGPNPSGCTHPKLPIGTNLNPVFSFPPDQSIYANLMDIAGYNYEILWFDAYGVVHRDSYEHFISSVYNFGNVTTAQWGDITDPSTFLLTVQDLEINTDMSDRRTSVTTVGLDASTGTQRQPYSISMDTIQPGYTQKNIGYHKQEFISSKRFVDREAQIQYTQMAMKKATIENIYMNGNFFFLPNTQVYNAFTLQEGSQYNNYNSYVTTMPLTFVITDRHAVYRAEYDGHITMGQQIKARWLQNLNSQ